MSKYSKGAQKEVAKEMHEYKRGEAHSGKSDTKVKSSVSPVFEKPAGTSKSPAGTKTGDKYASGGPGRPGPP